MQGLDVAQSWPHYRKNCVELVDQSVVHTGYVALVLVAVVVVVVVEWDMVDNVVSVEQEAGIDILMAAVVEVEGIDMVVDMVVDTVVVVDIAVDGVVDTVVVFVQVVGIVGVVGIVDDVDIVGMVVVVVVVVVGYSTVVVGVVAGEEWCKLAEVDAAEEDRLVGRSFEGDCCSLEE